MDSRQVGHAIRRRIGAPAHHATDALNGITPQVSPAEQQRQWEEARRATAPKRGSSAS